MIKQLADWLREKADELEGKDFPDLLGGKTFAEVVAGMAMSENRFEIMMALNYDKSSATSLTSSFRIHYPKHSKNSWEREHTDEHKTLAGAYAEYLRSDEPEVGAMQAVGDAMAVN